MSLDWNVSNVPNYKERCWVDVPAVNPRVSGEVRLADDTNALIWGSMMVDLGSITVKNIEEWCFRIEVLRWLDIRWMEHFEGDTVVGYFPDRESVEDHIGLTTNVTTMTRAKWMNKIKRKIEKRAEETCKAQLKQREKENNE